MAARRHLPVLSERSPAPTPANPDPAADEAPPWHWIPLGSVISIVAFALLAQGAAALSVRILARVYGPAATAAQAARIRAARPFEARAVELAAGLVPVAALLAAIALGGYVIGRHGANTNPRHGTLSGVCTALLVWGVTWAAVGFSPFMLALVPLGAAAGHLAARAGSALRARS